VEATDREGIRGMPAAILDPPEAGGVVARQPWIAGTVAREVIGRASAGRSVPSRGKPRPDQEPDEPTGGIGSSALRGRIRRSRSDGLSLRDESRGKLGEAVRITVYIQTGAETKCRHMNGTSVRSRICDTYGSLMGKSAMLKCHRMYRKSRLDRRVRFQSH
jgi:hypothetical protein